MTVSRALRGETANAAETSKRIVRIARSMGYRANPLISTLMTARVRSADVTATLAMIKMDRGREVRGFADGVQWQAEQQGFSIKEYTLLPSRLAGVRLRRNLVAYGIRALIFLPAPQVPYHLDLDLQGFCPVAIGNSIVQPRLPRVATNAYANTLAAIRRLYEYGYRRIGVVFLEDLDTRFMHGISAAIRVAPRVISTGLKIESHTPTDLKEFSPFSRKHGSKLARWIESHRLQVVVSQMDHLLDAFSERGIRVPEDVSYLHMHLHPNPEIACFDQLCNLAGRKAVDMVIAAINRNEIALPEYPGVLMIPSRWREGASVPRLSQRVLS